MLQTLVIFDSLGKDISWTPTNLYYADKTWYPDKTGFLDIRQTKWPRLSSHQVVSPGHRSHWSIHTAVNVYPRIHDVCNSQSHLYYSDLVNWHRRSRRDGCSDILDLWDRSVIIIMRADIAMLPINGMSIKRVPHVKYTMGVRVLLYVV